jgi:hypothetical protein
VDLVLGAVADLIPAFDDRVLKTLGVEDEPLFFEDGYEFLESSRSLSTTALF